MENFLTAKEAAKELNVKYHALLARCRRGKMPHIKVGWCVFINKDDIRKLRASHELDN